MLHTWMLDKIWSQGRILRKFPTNSILKAKWRQNLGNLRIFPTSAVCELHFNKTEFEKMREDGKRKLKQNAVLSLPEEVRQHLSKLNWAEKSDHSYTKLLPVNEFQTTSQQCTISQQPIEDNSIAQQLTEENLIAHQPTEENSIAQQLTEENSIAQQPIEENTINLINEQMKLITEQKQLILKLQEDAKKKDEKISIMERAVNNHFSLNRKHVHLKTAFNRLQKEYLDTKENICSQNCPFLKRPIFKADQKAALSRKSTRGLKWELDTIKEGLIYKMKFGTKGYTDFVRNYPLFPSIRCLQSHVQSIIFESGILNPMFDLMESLVKTLHDKEKDCCLVMDEMALKEDERLDPRTTSGLHLDEGELDF
ncbi:uncharacterized protein LOC143905886 isoform X2 [Temnothorax americanus]|uniref:uncharacterized protein LOC143905886 isoform X2 n=1 Tax=Temnothorax americanus TaxID=1964332 RepID=UPI0040698C85